MRYLRRFLQAIAITGTLIVGILAVSLIVSQTPWFKDWLRRYIMRESKLYLNGDLSIGRLGGNLFENLLECRAVPDDFGGTTVTIKLIAQSRVFLLQRFLTINAGTVIIRSHSPTTTIRTTWASGRCA